MTGRADIARLVQAEFDDCPIATPYECCAIAARVAVQLEARPWTDDLIRDTAASMAAGVFGPAFETGDDDQRTDWIAMCERAIRGELPVHH